METNKRPLPASNHLSVNDRDWVKSTDLLRLRMQTLTGFTSLTRTFGLNRAMFGSEPTIKRGGDRLSHRVGSGLVAKGDLRGAVDLVISHRPYMEVMNARDAGHACDGRAKLGELDPARYALQ